jgi:hypothetical protein
MPQIIVRCAQCNHALRVPESLYGEMIQCPACQNTFVAPSVAPDSRQADVTAPRPASAWPEPPRPSRDEFGYVRRDYLQPHRGAAVLVLGILSLITSCFPLGIAAWVMGHGDLAAMRRGDMDPSGEGITRAGQILGIISTVLVMAICGFYALIFAVVGIGQGFH